MSRIENLQGKASREEVEEAIQMLSDPSIKMTEIANKLNVSPAWVSLVNQGKLWYSKDYNYPIREIQVHDPSLVNHCCDCGKEINKRSVRCIECSKIYQRQQTFEKSLLALNNITREELKDLIRNKPFKEIGRMFNVTDNSVRKWCKRYNLPTRKMDINAISDEDWKSI